MRIAVAGGTGTVGKLVGASAERAGHDVVVLSRSAGVDLTTGTGAEAALAGCEAVIDVTNATTVSKKKATAFFEAVTGTLLAAEHAVGVRHHVVLSIVGVDRVPWGYYQAKLHQEHLVRDGGVPWTVLRATQFHEFAEQMLARKVAGLALVPRMRSATVAASEVADLLVDLAVARPVGDATELAGPETHSMPDLVRRVAAADGGGRVLAVRLPGAAGRAMAGDGLLPTGDAVVGAQTFAEWLAARGSAG